MSVSSRPSAHAHRLVHSTAIGMAHEFYDALMNNDQLWKLWQDEHPGANRTELEQLFVRKHTAQLLPKARAALAAMLAQPIDCCLKDTILEALTLDATLMKGR